MLSKYIAHAFYVFIARILIISAGPGAKYCKYSQNDNIEPELEISASRLFMFLTGKMSYMVIYMITDLFYFSRLHIAIRFIP